VGGSRQVIVRKASRGASAGYWAGLRLGIALAVLVGIIILARVLRRHEREGDWDKEGHGTLEHQEPRCEVSSAGSPTNRTLRLTDRQRTATARDCMERHTKSRRGFRHGSR
jgi:hypothetical protein